MQSLLTLLSLSTAALAITVTKPGKHELWDSSKSNTISWSSVSTDPQSVDIYLSHLAAWPPTNSLLFSNVPTSQGSAVVSGLQLPNGEAYQINLVAHDKPEQIYAQSQQFNVTGEGVAATSTLDGYTGPTYTPTASGSATRTTLATSTTGTSTETETSTASADGTSETESASAQATESSESSPSQTSNGTGSSSSTSSAVPTQSRSAAVGNTASGPLAALVLGVAAFFL